VRGPAGVDVAFARPDAPPAHRVARRGSGRRALEVGYGNGSISAWLAEHVGPRGGVVGVGLDLSLIDARAPNLEIRQGDIAAGPVDPGGLDLVTARAVLHHVTAVKAAIQNLVASLAPGGSILLMEPDFLPVSIASSALSRSRQIEGGIAVEEPVRVQGEADGLTWHDGVLLDRRLVGHPDRVPDDQVAAVDA
jgi:SAM-dependent methyltransferase